MSEPYIGEIRIFAGNFAPSGWAFCDGQLVAIQEYETLFNLIGTTYGGDGQQTFALPDLRGRVPIHQGGQNVIGQLGGSETVTLNSQQLPIHTHPLNASSNLADQNGPGGNVLAQLTQGELYFAAAGTAHLSSASIASQGGDQSHSNLQPYLCLNFIISLFGIYPSQ